jgi:hypothetical protein
MLLDLKWARIILASALTVMYLCDGVCMFMLLRIRHRLLFLFIFPSLLLVGVHPKFICLSQLSLGSYISSLIGRHKNKPETR